MNNTNKSEWDSGVSAVLMNLTRCCSASCAHAARRHQGFCLAGCPPTNATQLSPRRRGSRADRDWNHTSPLERNKQGLQSCWAAKLPFPHHVSGSLAFTGFVGRKIWVYVCTYNIWQQGGIQIQLRRMLFAWVTVLAMDLFQRLLSEELFSGKEKHKFPGFYFCAYWLVICHAKKMWVSNYVTSVGCHS